MSKKHYKIIDRPKERLFEITCGANKGERLLLRKKKTRWHLVSSSKHISYSQEELDDLIMTGWLDERS